MKLHVWILLLISISTFIDATSNDSTSAAVKFILSHSTLTRRDISTDSSGILIRKNILSSNMSSALTVTTPQSIPLVSSTTVQYFGNVHNQEFRRNKSVLLEQPLKAKRSAMKEKTMAPECELFSIGSNATKTFSSPGYPDHYTKNMSCVRVLEAPPGYLLRLDFRDHFNIEPSDDCKFDYLEIRDGAHGFSTKIGQYCGHNFPDIITSTGRFLWLHFHSDENIEYEGFKAVYEYIPRPTSAVYDDLECGETLGGFEGFVNETLISQEKLDAVVKNNLPLDCLWMIQVEEDWKIQLSFTDFKLDKPNDCDSNFVDVFGENTDLPSRLRNFCGSMADSSVQSKTNILHIRYFAEAAAIKSSFKILYTAYRDKGKGQCREDEYDCDDHTCIKSYLRCNRRNNCRLLWDEDPTKCEKSNEESEHVFIIVVVFCVMLAVMLIAFIISCMRKILRDHKIIREHIRQSHESKLDELGRHSTKLTKSKENIAMHTLTKIPPPSFDPDSPTSINLIENNSTNHQYYREAITNTNGARNIDSKNNFNLREQEIKNIFGSSYEDDRKDGEMCDMACQTRESLFQPVFKNKVTQSPSPYGLRFSTFGYLDSSTPSPPPPPNIEQTIPGASCPTHSQSGKSTMPHQHQHHHHYHHIHSSTNQSSPEGIDTSAVGTNVRMDELQTMLDDDKHKKILLKRDDTQGRSYSDVRKSAPDVVIIAGCTSSH
ncbi:CLUMA_CG017215, isoform A [Clunio marinus]|uniref:CLUMA_CG017215, isoform A n=1 Tax=Clunio marinus TaxID=568069 RepID=A0A1J1IY83_9DIPT|nr:CLUMA_CG017215, isoform A [Clunio marinus]